MSVMRSDTSGANAYASKTISFPSHFWVQGDVYIPSSTLSALVSGDGLPAYTSTLLYMGDGPVVGSLDGVHWGWVSANGSATPTGTFTPNAWHTVVYEVQDIGGGNLSVSLTVDGSALITSHTDVATVTSALEAGGRGDATGVVYYLRNIKVGTSLGGSQLFSDDFHTGDFSAWSSTTGAVTVVGDPAPGADTGTWTYKLCDWKTDSTLLDLTNAATATISARLNRPMQLTVTMAADTAGLTTNAADGKPNLSKLRRTLKFYRNGILRGHGRIDQIEWSGDANTRTVTVTAHDPLLQCQNRTVFDNGGNLADPDFADPISGAEIIKTIIDNSVTYEDNIIGGTTPAIFPIDTASGTFDTTIPPAVDLSAELTDWPASVGDIISLVTDTGACDLIIRPVDSTMGFTAGIIGELSVLNTAGADLSDTVVFDYGTGTYNVAAVRRLEDGTTLCNKLIYYLGPKIDHDHWRGNITATETTPVDLSSWLTKEMASRADYGTWDTIRVYDSNGDENSARPLFHELWETEVDLRVQGRELFYITPQANPSGPFPFDDYNLGDIVGVNVTGLGPTVTGATQRIYGFDITIDADGVERVGELKARADDE